MQLLARGREGVGLAEGQFGVRFDLFQGLLGEFQRRVHLLFLAARRAEGFDTVDLGLDVGGEDGFDEFGILSLGRLLLFQAVFLDVGIDFGFLRLFAFDADRVALA